MPDEDLPTNTPQTEPTEDDNAQTGAEQTKTPGGRTPDKPLNPPPKD